MTNWLRKIASIPTTWLIIPSLLVALPMLFFGNPGFYGDDLNFLAGRNTLGLWGYIWNWCNNYGVIYRPLGITIETLLYEVFGNSASLIYWVSMVIYIGTICSLFSQLRSITKNLFASAFVTMFFALFPFNPTAFLQLSSMYQVIACLCAILMVGTLAKTRKPFTLRQIFIWGVIWLSLLLIYEQLTGLVSVIVLLLAFEHHKESFRFALRRSLPMTIVLCVITGLFMAAYLVTPNNPKMISLKTLNQKDFSVVKKLAAVTKQDLGQNLNEAPENNTSSVPGTGRCKAIFSRILKTSMFFSESIGYAWNALAQRGGKGIVVVVILAISAILIFFIPITPLSREQAVAFVVLGFVWSLSTVAPFLLYKAVHLPPYTLLLPGLGVGAMLVGALRMLLPLRYARLNELGLKSCLVAIVLIFSFLQYGYYFGLREELSYWREMSERLEPVIPIVNDGNTVQVTGIPEKHNKHIFWLEKAVGIRFLLARLGEKGNGLDVQTDHNKRTIRIFPKDVPKSIQSYDFNALKR